MGDPVSADGETRYDTISGHLAAAGAQLDRRNGHWRVRLPKERGVARRVELPALQNGTMPSAIGDIVVGLAHGEPVVPVAKPDTSARRAVARLRVPHGHDGHVIERALTRSVERLMRNDGLVRLGDDDEAIHQARVAVRTLRADLRTFVPMLDAEGSAALRRDLAPLADLLGATRDADVLTARVARRLVNFSAQDAKELQFLLTRLNDQRNVAVEQLATFMRSGDYFSLLNRLGDVADLVVREPPASALVALAQAPWRRLTRDVDHLSKDPSDQALHATRLRVKRARYAVEAVLPAAGKPFRSLAKSLAGLQDVLGEHQDAVVMGEFLRQAVVGTRKTATLFVAGMVAGIEHRAAAEARFAWRHAWHETRRAAPSAWS
jgi:CHAD domain-containing protein